MKTIAFFSSVIIVLACISLTLRGMAPKRKSKTKLGIAQAIIKERKTARRKAKIVTNSRIRRRWGDKHTD